MALSLWQLDCFQFWLKTIKSHQEFLHQDEFWNVLLYSSIFNFDHGWDFILVFFPSALPKAPGSPVVTERTATSITLTWDSGNPEPVSYYVIQVCSFHSSTRSLPEHQHVQPHFQDLVAKTWHLSWLKWIDMLMYVYVEWVWTINYLFVDSYLCDWSLK